jgi:hypothetical protein
MRSSISCLQQRHKPGQPDLTADPLRAMLLQYTDSHAGSWEQQTAGDRLQRPHKIPHWTPVWARLDMTDACALQPACQHQLTVPVPSTRHQLPTADGLALAAADAPTTLMGGGSLTCLCHQLNHPDNKGGGEGSSC